MLGMKVPGAAAIAATVATNLRTCTAPAASLEGPAAGKFYQIADGKVVKDGRTNGSSVMKGFGDDPNIAPDIVDIYAYPQARADGVLGPARRDWKTRLHANIPAHARYPG